MAYVDPNFKTKKAFSDVGCYVDNVHGIHMVDRIVEIANDHGADIKHECPKSDDHTFSMCPHSGDYWDEATDYMNEHYGVNNCYWGTSDTFGDWGLWEVVDDLRRQNMKKETAHLFAFPTDAQRQQFIAEITALDPDVSYATSRSTAQGDPVNTFIVAVRP